MRYEWTKALKALALGTGLLSLTACGQAMDRFKKPSAEAQAGQAYLAKVAQEKGVIKLPSGILYKVIASPNPTAPQASPSDYVKVHYEGTLIDGTKFDSSYDRGVPTAFPLNGVVKAWQIVVPLMHKGDTWMIYVPSELGYGSEAAGPIPANSVLIFKIELIDIMKV